MFNVSILYHTVNCLLVYYYLVTPAEAEFLIKGIFGNCWDRFLLYVLTVTEQTVSTCWWGKSV